jgi:hypothetical protein
MLGQGQGYVAATLLDSNNAFLDHVLMAAVLLLQLPPSLKVV